MKNSSSPISTQTKATSKVVQVSSQRLMKLGQSDCEEEEESVERRPEEKSVRYNSHDEP